MPNPIPAIHLAHSQDGNLGRAPMAFALQSPINEVRFHPHHKLSDSNFSVSSVTTTFSLPIMNQSYTICSFFLLRQNSRHYNTQNWSLIIYLTLFIEFWPLISDVKVKTWEESIRLKLSHKQIIKQIAGTN